MTSIRAIAVVLMVTALGACSTDREAGGESAPGSADLPSSYAEREGRVLFRHYCATCHGEAGQGDGFNAFNLDPRPRDLTDMAFQAGQSDADLADVIRGGGASVGLSTAMPPWGHTLDARSIAYLVAYLRTLPTDEE